MKFKILSNKLGNFFGLLILTVLLLEIIRVFILDIPQYRYLQLLWHMQHNDIIKIANCQIKLPINWTIKSENKDQYILQADLRNNGTLQVGVLYKNLPSNAEQILAKNCTLGNYMKKEYSVAQDKIKMTWCKKLSDGGSLSIFRNKNISLVMYDYEPNDYANVKLLFQNIRCTVKNN